MQKVLIFLIFLLGVVVGIFIPRQFLEKQKNEIEKTLKIERPLDIYTIDNLSKSDIKSGEISFSEPDSQNEKFSTYIFSFEFNPNLDGKTLKKTKGMLNLPAKDPIGIIVMIRGFVSQELYQTGMGTKNAANFFADNGFITIAPDFLGYADSDKESEDIFESRFQTYVTVLSLLKNIELRSDQFVKGYDKLIQQNKLPVFLWAHSNGGQIALTALTVSKSDYPTVLWAPVTKPFPYSILYYTDEADDGGKYLRSKLADFEKLYDTELYSPANYYDRIIAPIRIAQGTFDEEVLETWSNEFVEIMQKNEKSVDYQTYFGADHNMRPHWDNVVQDDLNFFLSFITKANNN